MSVDLSGHEAGGLLRGKGDYGLVSVDGHLLQLAQWPNRGYNHIDRILAPGTIEDHLTLGVSYRFSDKGELTLSAMHELMQVLDEAVAATRDDDR